MQALLSLSSALRGMCSGLYINGRLLNRYGGFNEVAVQVLLGRLRVCRRRGIGDVVAMVGDFPILSGVGGHEADCLIDHKCSDQVSCNAAMPEHPRFIIDVSLWRRHTKGELSSLMVQLMQTIREVRRYLWDGNITISGADPEFISLFKATAGNMRTMVKFTGSIPVDYLKSAIMLDPYGEVELTETMVKATETFIIGGISDSEVVRRGETYELYRLIKLGEYGVPRVRITLRGVLTGVPERINKIVSILLMVRFSGYSIDDAIIVNQSKADKLVRLNRELNLTKPTSPSDVYELLTWLGLTPWDSKVQALLRRIKLPSP